MNCESFGENGIQNQIAMRKSECMCACIFFLSVDGTSSFIKQHVMRRPVHQMNTSNKSRTHMARRLAEQRTVPIRCGCVCGFALGISILHL